MANFELSFIRMLPDPSISASFILIMHFITLESKGYTDISYQ